MGCYQTQELLESYLAEAFVESFERPVYESQLERKEIQYGRNTASDLSSREFLLLHQAMDEVKPMKTLKISADVFIHHIHLQLENKGEAVSVRVDNGIITDLKTESPRKTNLRKFMIGTSLSEWTRGNTTEE